MGYDFYSLPSLSVHSTVFTRSLSRSIRSRQTTTTSPLRLAPRLLYALPLHYVYDNILTYLPSPRSRSHPCSIIDIDIDIRFRWKRHWTSVLHQLHLRRSLMLERKSERQMCQQSIALSSRWACFFRYLVSPQCYCCQSHTISYL